MEKEQKTLNLPQERGITEYQVAGNTIKLSFDIVKNYLTKGDGKVTDADLVQFISICKFNQLNPFLNEAYLVKFGSSPAQMIVSKEALMKRAEGCKEYRGIQAGVIIERAGEIIELEGNFYTSKDILLGGWAKVYRSDRDFPVIAKVRLDEFDKKQSSWKSMASTMISKVAKVQALREAFPSQLGAMYTQEEQIIDVNHVDVTSRETQQVVIEQPEPQTNEPLKMEI